MRNQNRSNYFENRSHEGTQQASLFTITPMNRRIKILGIILLAIVLYYGLQYISTAIHYNCRIIKDDCVPPINGPSEVIYRVMIRPFWLDQFEIKPTTYFFKDGKFNFWEGEVDGKVVVIRVREDDSAVMQWVEQGLPLKIGIRPARGENIGKWLTDHPEYELSE
jgi:hypothetical protein